ncbi:MAG: ribulose-phosphate 3-epimerase [Ignavibacteriales bacterium]|nr:ribulose-phosphate 3-epimerase [Ignavibacteriales bacterium]
MRNNVKIAPSVLAADFANLKEEVAQAEHGGADWLHLDVMDGHFVPNISFGPFIVGAIREQTKLPLDTHLMIESPEKYLDDFRRAGSDIITVHQEACKHLQRTVALIKELGAKAGVAINPATSTSLLSNIMDDVDLILIMSVNPGFGGQKFIKGSERKIREVREMIEKTGREIHLEVDGGIDTGTAPAVVRAGANVLVAGTSIFRGHEIKKAIEDLRKSYR